VEELTVTLTVLTGEDFTDSARRLRR
jgi:hypothetical protein